MVQQPNHLPPSRPTCEIPLLPLLDFQLIHKVD
jgi:hypothetical protein